MLKFQKLDRRMSGHNYFKWRVEFNNRYSNYTNEQNYSGFEVGKLRRKTWIEALEYLTQVYGFGPDLDKAYYYNELKGVAPRFATRICRAGDNFFDTLYLRGDEEREEFEKFLIMLELKR
jgi:hypothetical protein